MAQIAPLIDHAQLGAGQIFVEGCSLFSKSGQNQLTYAFQSRFKVMDDDAFQKDRMIAWACFRLDRFPQGLQLLELHGIDGKPTGGLLLVSSQIVYK
jgi:hypothetical protein